MGFSSVLDLVHLAARPRLRKGRVITAYGWHRFKSNVGIASMAVHVEAGTPLLIQQVSVSQLLIDDDRYAVRSFLVSCALAVAKSLQTDAEIDHGWLDWQVPEHLAGEAAKVAPGFAPDRKRARKRRGTDVILRHKGESA